jgi:hypothetical protein
MRTLDLIEAAQFLRVHPHTLEAKARAGEVPGAKPGKCWVFIDVDLAEWLRSKYKTDSLESHSCLSENAEKSGIANGRSAASELQKRLARQTATPRRNTMTAAVLKFGDNRNSVTPA